MPNGTVINKGPDFYCIINILCCILGFKVYICIVINNSLVNFEKYYFCHLFQPVTAGSGYSPLSPDMIDLEKYPDYAKVPWLYTTIYPGDCVYIPASKYTFLKQRQRMNVKKSLR